MHPLSLAARRYDPSVAKERKVPRYLGLALFQNLNEITYTDLATVHEIEQPETRGIGEGCEEASQVKGLGGTTHVSNIRLDRYGYLKIHSHKHI